MFKNLISVFLFSISTIVLASTQQESNKLNLNINFSWQNKHESNSERHYISNVHFNKIITLDSNKKNYQIAFAQSKMLGKLPATLILLIKPTKVTSESADFQLEVLEYGFSKGGTIWTQPHLTLLNGKTAEMIFPTQSNPHMNLKISGKWV